MKKRLTSEKLLLQEVSKEAKALKKAQRGLSISEMIKILRTQLGLTQAVLAKKAGVPQSTISRLEQGMQDPTLSTLNKILHALSSDLIVSLTLDAPIHDILKKQALKKAKKRVRYLKGTMNMESQEPDADFTHSLLEDEVENLLRGPRKHLWD